MGELNTVKVVKRIFTHLTRTKAYNIVLEYIRRLGVKIEETREPHYIRIALGHGYKLGFSKVGLEINIMHKGDFSEVVINWSPTGEFVIEMGPKAVIGGSIGAALSTLMFRSDPIGTVSFIIIITLFFLFHPITPPGVKMFVEELINILKETEAKLVE